MFRKIIAYVMMISFAYSAFGALDVQGAIELSEISQAITQLKTAQNPQFPTFNLDIPMSLGRITGGCDGGGNVLVVNIQDLHCHAEVQRNITDILRLLDTKYGLKKVFVEGGYGALNTSWLNTVQDAAVKKQVMDALRSSGRLTGSEYYAMSSGRYDMLQGMEDEKLHKANIVRLGKILEKKPQYEEKLKELSRDLEFMRAKYLTSRNKRFNDVLAQYKAGRIDTAHYYLLLNKYVEKINEHPEQYHNVLPLQCNQFPAIQSYLQTESMQKNLCFNRIQAQLRECVQALKNKLPYSEYNNLLKKTDNFTNPEVLYAQLAQMSTQYHLEINRNFPDLADFFSYIEINRTINPLKLVSENQRLIEQLRIAFSGNIAEQEVSFLSDFFDCFEDYLLNRLSAQDYDYFQSRFEKFKATWGKYTYKNHVLDCAADFPLLNDYYALNDQRNTFFIKNMLSAVSAPLAVAKREKTINRSLVAREQRGKEKPTVIVMISGGFHTVGIARLLEQRHISYLTITPNVTCSATYANDIYDKITRYQAKLFGSQALSDTPLGSLNPRVTASGSEIRVHIDGGERFIVENGRLRIEGANSETSPTLSEHVSEFQILRWNMMIMLAVLTTRQTPMEIVPGLYALVNLLGDALAELGLSDEMIWNIAVRPEVQEALIAEGINPERVSRWLAPLQTVAAGYAQSRALLETLSATTSNPLLKAIASVPGVIETMAALSGDLHPAVTIEKFINVPAPPSADGHDYFISSRRHLLNAIDVSDVAVDHEGIFARGEVHYIRPEQLQLTIVSDERVRNRDFISDRLVDNDSRAGRTIQDWVAQAERPEEVVAAFNLSQGHNFVPNTLTIVDGKIVIRAQGKRGLDQSVYESPHGVFHVFSLDAEKKGVYDITLDEQGRLMGELPVRNGFGGILLMRDYEPMIDGINLIKPCLDGNSVDWDSIDKRQSFTVYGFNNKEEMVIVQIAGDPDNTAKGEPTLRDVIEILKQLKVKDAVLGGTSADVQRYHRDSTPHVLMASAREGSIVQRFLGKINYRGWSQRRMGQALLISLSRGLTDAEVLAQAKSGKVSLAPGEHKKADRQQFAGVYGVSAPSTRASGSAVTGRPLDTTDPAEAVRIAKRDNLLIERTAAGFTGYPKTWWVTGDVSEAIRTLFRLQRKVSIDAETGIGADGKPKEDRFIKIEQNGTGDVVQYAVYDAQGKSTVYSREIPASVRAKASLIVVFNIVRASRPARPSVARKDVLPAEVEASPGAYNLLPSHLARNPLEMVALWKSPHGSVWGIETNQYPIWPYDTAKSESDQIDHVVISRADTQADGRDVRVGQAEMRSLENIRDVIEFQKQANASLPEGASRYIAAVNGWFYSRKANAVKAGATQNHAHAQLLRAYFPLQNAPVKKIGSSDGIDVGVVNDEGWGSAIVLETDDTSLDALAAKMHDLLAAITAREHSFNYIVMPQNGRLRAYVFDRVLTMPEGLSGEPAFCEVSRAFVVDDPQIFFKLTDDQKREYMNLGNEAVHHARWVEEHIVKGDLRLNTDFFNTARAALKTITAGKDETEQLARSIINPLSNGSRGGQSFASEVTPHIAVQELAKFLSSSDVKETDLKADEFIICGNSTIETFEFVLDAYLQRKVKHIIIAGGHGRLTLPLIRAAVQAGYPVDVGRGDNGNRTSLVVTKDNIRDFESLGTEDELMTITEKSEAEIIQGILALMAARKGKKINPADVTLETESTNTPENFKNVLPLLHYEGRTAPLHVAFIASPLQQARTKATFNKVFAKLIANGSVQGISVSAQPAEQSNETLARSVIQEMQRMILYTASGDLMPGDNGIDSIADINWRYMLRLLQAYGAGEMQKDIVNNIVNLKRAGAVLYPDTETLLRGLNNPRSFMLKAVITEMYSIAGKAAQGQEVMTASNYRRWTGTGNNDISLSMSNTLAVSLETVFGQEAFAAMMNEVVGTVSKSSHGRANITIALTDQPGHLFIVNGQKITILRSIIDVAKTDKQSAALLLTAGLTTLLVTAPSEISDTKIAQNIIGQLFPHRIPYVRFRSFMDKNALFPGFVAELDRLYDRAFQSVIDRVMTTPASPEDIFTKTLKPFLSPLEDKERSDVKAHIEQQEQRLFSSLARQYTGKIPLREYMIGHDPQRIAENKIKEIVAAIAVSHPRDAMKFEAMIWRGIDVMYQHLPDYLFDYYLSDTGLVAEHTLMHSLNILLFSFQEIVPPEEFNRIDWQAMIFATLAHDMSYMIYPANHGINSATWISAILKQAGVNRKMIEKVFTIASGHNKMIEPGVLSPEHVLFETRVLNDADALDGLSLEKIYKVKTAWAIVQQPDNTIERKRMIFNPDLTLQDRLNVFQTGNFWIGDALTDLMRHAWWMRDPGLLLTARGKSIVVRDRPTIEEFRAFLEHKRDELREQFAISDDDFIAMGYAIDSMFTYLSRKGTSDTVVPESGTRTWRLQLSNIMHTVLIGRYATGSRAGAIAVTASFWGTFLAAGGLAFFAVHALMPIVAIALSIVIGLVSGFVVRRTVQARVDFNFMRSTELAVAMRGTKGIGSRGDNQLSVTVWGTQEGGLKDVSDALGVTPLPLGIFVAVNEQDTTSHELFAVSSREGHIIFGFAEDGLHVNASIVTRAITQQLRAQDGFAGNPIFVDRMKTLIEQSAAAEHVDVPPLGELHFSQPILIDHSLEGKAVKFLNGMMVVPRMALPSNPLEAQQALDKLHQVNVTMGDYVVLDARGLNVAQVIAQTGTASLILDETQINQLTKDQIASINGEEKYIYIGVENPNMSDNDSLDKGAHAAAGTLEKRLAHLKLKGYFADKAGSGELVSWEKGRQKSRLMKGPIDVLVTQLADNRRLMGSTPP
ncbi:MAG: hypothetical protein ABSH12_00605, partial [Endomicrobiales bacterium]